MTRIALEIPKVGLVMDNARLGRWLKKVGDAVTQGEPLVELETEKSVVEIESTASGRLVEILLEADQEARVGDRIAWIETGEPLRIVSSPVARRLAASQGADLRQITGTGPRGRVQLVDVRRALESRPASAGVATATLSSMRRALARSMTLSNATVPQFTVERAVDLSSVNGARADSGASITDFVLHALARTLIAFPALNATFSGDVTSPDARIVPASGAHIGLVVAVENGLRVPVLHGVEQLTLDELTRLRRTAVERALDGVLRQDELEGATVSVSNLGPRGPDRFNALINPPQSAILAVGRQRDQVVSRNGGIEVRPVSQLTLTVDHRVADGRLASDFLAFVVDLLEGASP